MARNEQSAKTPLQLELLVESRYLNIGQVADILGVPKSFIYRRTARGHGDPIPHYRIGSHLRFKPTDSKSGSRATVTSRRRSRQELSSLVRRPNSPPSRPRPSASPDQTSCGRSIIYISFPEDGITRARVETRVEELLVKGATELGNGEWVAARASYLEAVEFGESAPALEGLGAACWWLRDSDAAIEARRRAFRLYLDDGDRSSGGRVARLASRGRFLALSM